MAKYQSKVVAGKASVPTAGVAGVVVVQEVEFVAPTGGTNANDVIEMAILPADARIVDAVVSSGAAGACKLGFLGSDGATAGTELGTLTLTADTPARMATGFGLLREPDADRVVTVSLDAVIAAGKKVYLQIRYAQ